MPSISLFDRLIARKDIASYPPAIPIQQAPPTFAQKIHPDIDALLEHFSSLGATNDFTHNQEARRHTFDGALPIIGVMQEGTANNLDEHPDPDGQALQTQVSHFGLDSFNKHKENCHSPVRSPSFLYLDNQLASESREKARSVKPAQRISNTTLNTLSHGQASKSYPRKRVRTHSGSTSTTESSTQYTFGRPSPRPTLPHIDMVEFGVIGKGALQWYADTAPPPLPPLDHPAFAESRPANSKSRNIRRVPENKLHQRNGIGAANRAPPQNTPSKSHVRKLSHLSPLSFSRKENVPIQSENKHIHRARSATFIHPSARLTAGSTTPIRASQFLDPNFSIRREKRKSAIKANNARVAESKSVSSIRRLSAEWNALQASKGVGEGANWQAEVAREILLLSGISVPEISGNNLSRDSHVVVSPPLPSPIFYRSSVLSTDALPPCHSFPPHSFTQDLPVQPQLSSAPQNTHSLAQDCLWVDSVSLRENQRKVKTTADNDMFHKSANHRRARTRDPLPSAFTNAEPEQDAVSDFGLVGDANPARSAPLAALESTSPTVFPSSNAIEPSSTPSILKNGEYSTPSKGKRKADDLEETTPPDKKRNSARSTRTTSFAEPIILDRIRRESSNAPSSYASYRSKRARLSASNPISETPSRSSSRTGSVVHHPAASASNLAPPQDATVPLHSRTPTPSRTSHVSLPISALISPHAPSISRDSTFYMKDPRKPSKRPARTGWSLRFAQDGEPGSPIHAWFFFTAFILFPLWWVASFWRIPRTRRVGDEEKVAIDDPQVEYDAISWRFRCRVMSIVSVFTYIPFIILVAIFA